MIAAWVAFALARRRRCSRTRRSPPTPPPSWPRHRAEGAAGARRTRRQFAAEARRRRVRGTCRPRSCWPGCAARTSCSAFVESYGRSALEDPKMAAVLDPALAASDRQLTAAGLLRPQRLPHLVDLRRRQLAGPRHVPVRPVDRQPAALPAARLGRPADPDQGVPDRPAGTPSGSSRATRYAWPEARFYGYDRGLRLAQPGLPRARGSAGPDARPVHAVGVPEERLRRAAAAR